MFFEISRRTGGIDSYEKDGRRRFRIGCLAEPDRARYKEFDAEEE